MGFVNVWAVAPVKMMAKRKAKVKFFFFIFPPCLSVFNIMVLASMSFIFTLSTILADVYSNNGGAMEGFLCIA